MEIRELHLAAFGPFTDRKLVFAQDSGGLHIIYGPNEAGKSSALRGLRSLLFGISETTTDNFIHLNDKLRIAGRIRSVKGADLVFARRKGRRNTLSSLDGNSLDDAALTIFLRDVSQEIFDTLFGIDHDGLVQGGQEILEQKGEVGQALFSASLGSHTLHAVLANLDEEADGLFKQRGSTQIINLALKEYSEQQKKIKLLSLSSREWQEHRDLLDRNGKELEQVQTELIRARFDVNRLKRIQQVLPKLVRRNDLLQKLEALSHVVILPGDFKERHKKAVGELEKALAILQKAAFRRDGYQGQLKVFSVRQDLLERSESIEALHARLGEHRKAMEDRPGLDVQCKQLLVEIGSLLKEVRPGLALSDVDLLRPVFANRRRIAELGAQNMILNQRVKQANKNLIEIEAKLSAVRKDSQQFQDTGSTDELRRAIAIARKAGDVDNAIQSGRSELGSLERQCDANLARLTHWNGALEAVLGLPVPTRESINRFDEEYAELNKRFQRFQEKQNELAGKRHEAARQLDEIQQAGEVPMEKDLIEARSDRDKAWRLLRRQWVDGEDVNVEAHALDAEGSLPDAFEIRVNEADKLADRLRREADRVQKRAGYIAEQEDAKRRGGEIAKQLDECAARKKQIDAEWQALWVSCGIQPSSPREMRAWLDNFEKLHVQVERLTSLGQQVNELEHSRETHIQVLKQQLNILGEEIPESASLEMALMKSDETLNELDALNRRREMLDKEAKTLERALEAARAECREASNDFDAWKGLWAEAVKGLGLASDALPSEATNVIENIAAIFTKQGEAEKLDKRIHAIDVDAVAFRDQVGKMVENVAPEITKMSTDEAVIRLNSLLSESRSLKSRRQQIEEQLQQACQEIRESDATIQAMNERLDVLCKEARCNSHAELEVAERMSAEYRQLRQEMAGVEKEILEAGEGATISELELEAKGVDRDMLSGQIDVLARQIDDDFEPRRTKLAETKGREERDLENMNGSDQAAELAAQGQAVLAGIRSNAERYVRLKLAAKILRSQIESYRKENQGPLIKSASQYFALLTQGSFEGLSTDYDENDMPVLAGIRPNGQKVHVEGMSMGTRDQLYLALRLASLDKYMENSEPIPFIVDDILVDFDDKRTEAALSVLSGFAKKTQVILFTHHSHVVEQARKLGVKQGNIHDL